METRSKKKRERMCLQSKSENAYTGEWKGQESLAEALRCLHKNPNLTTDNTDDTDWEDRVIR
jgi:hypothetical protein